MRFRHLQHYVAMIMVSSALVLSAVFSLLAYHVNQRIAVQESETQVRNLMSAVQNTASAALFSGNEAVGWDAINGLIGNDVVHAAELVGFADELGPGMHLSSSAKRSGTALPQITIKLESLFEAGRMLGELRVSPSAQWVQQRVHDTSIPTVIGVIVVIFVSSLVSAKALEMKLSAPLVTVRNALKDIHADSAKRLFLPDHLKTNEIGALVDGFNELLDETNAAFEVERGLREEMKEVQNSLQEAKARAEQAAQAKSEFLATMSYEIRTPLSGILGILDLALKDSAVHERTRQQLDIAKRNAKSLLTIINDILDYSRMEVGELKIEAVDFCLRDEVAAAVAVFADMAKDKQIGFHYAVDDDVPQVVNSDPARIRQILVNLIGNAINATTTGGVELQVSMLELTKNRVRLSFDIRDTGSGIDEEELAQLFSMKEPDDASAARKFGGMALGLSISKQLVEAMYGIIEVTSVAGQGSTFHFELPMGRGMATAAEDVRVAL